MTAPRGAYLTKAVRFKNAGSSYIAYFLQDYSTANLAKSTFKLDGIAKFSGDEVGFIGYATGANLKYHNPSRYGRFRIGDKVFFNDGGLNVRGHGETGTRLLDYANLVYLEVYFKSAYYADSSNFGLKYKINSGAWVTATNQNFDNILQTTLKKKLAFNAPLLLYPDAQKNDTLSVKAFIVNTEGEYESDVVNFALADRIQELGAYFRNSPQSPAGETAVDLWMFENDVQGLNALTTTSQSSGLFAFKDVYRAQKINSGWYVGLIENKALYADSTGQFTHYETLVLPSLVIYASVDVYMAEDLASYHEGIMFQMNFNAPTNIAISGYVSEAPAGQPQVGGFSFSGTLVQGSKFVYIADNANFKYKNTSYYLVVNSTPVAQFIGDGQFK